MDPRNPESALRPIPTAARHASRPGRTLTAHAVAKGSGRLAAHPQASTTDPVSMPDQAVAAHSSRKLGAGRQATG
jgi:hypothetical protein